MIEKADILIRVCSISEVYLTLPPEKKTDYWGVPDPYGVDYETYMPHCRQARELIKEKVLKLIEELKVEN